MANRTNLTTLRVISIFLVVLAASAIAAGEVIYVDADANGANDGSSWADAFNDLQDGLTVAWSGDEIRVAQGIYKPDEDSAHPNGTGYRTATFRLKNGVAVKGGYAGFGQPDPNARDIEVYETILSGDLLGNDRPDFANNYENSYRVVTGSRTNDTAVLDGFIITGGNTSPSYNTGGGMYNNSGSPTVTNCTFSGNRSEEYGGGMYNRNESSPTVTNCTFSGNRSEGYGGGMFNESSSSPMVTNCTFADNSANSGGGMQNSNSSNPVLIDCTFTGNSVEWTFPGGGGGMHNNDSNPIVTNCTFSGNSGWRGGGMRNTNSSPTLTNCTFNDNSAEFGGGMVNSGSSPMVTNCTFIRNIASARGGGMFNPGNGAPILTNCILWGDSPQEVDGGPHVITYSDVQGGWPGTGNINANPLFVDPAIGDYHLLAGSPCIDAGDNSAVPPSVVTDLDGNPRIIGGTVDMGAYESSYQGFLLSAESVIVPEGRTATFTVMLVLDPLGTLEVTVAVESGDSDITVESGGLLTFNSTNYSQPQTVALAAAEDADELHGATVILVSAPGVYPDGVTAYELDSEAATELYVDCDASGANNGLSWEDAFTELREGLSFAAGTFWVKEIRVAQGIYKPAPPSGPPLPPTAAPTGGSNSGGSEVTPGDRTATFQLINGVAIKGGYAGFGEPDPNVRDIELYETILSGDLNGDDGPDFASNGENSYHVVTGSGTDETAVLDGFTITAGNANSPSYTDPNSKGGGMFNDTGSPTLSNCTFIGNAARWNGGGMYNRLCNSMLSNCTFSGNSAGTPSGGHGGGIYNYRSSPTLTNCTFSGNWAGQGGGMSNMCYSSPTISSCIFSNNSANFGAGMGAKDCSSIAVTRCTFSGNSAGGRGGGAEYINSSPTLTNCIFVGNSAASRYGGAISVMNTSTPTVTNCTFVANSAPEGRALACDSHEQRPSDLRVTNSILWDGGDEVVNKDGSTITITYSDVQNGYFGTGNIYANPRFVAPIIGDYHLQPDSPCINAGDPNYVAGPNETDLDGKPRVIGGQIDMGAYEYPNTTPVACIVGADRIVECEGCWGARVTLDGSCSSDADSAPRTNDDIVSFDWYKVDACAPNFEDFFGSGEIIDCNLPLGEHIIVLEVTDRAGAFDTNKVTIIVQDTTPPDFTLSVTPTTLWPVNHKMVLITPSWTASDICDESPQVSLVSITMNEDDEARGDGQTTNDIQVDDNGLIYLRAERSGAGSGRIYTITYQVVDDSGNAAVARATVTVPHDQR